MNLPAYTAAPPARTAMRRENLETMSPTAARAMPEALALSSSDCIRRPFTSGVRANRNAVAPAGRLIAELDVRESTHDDGLVQKALAEAARAARAQKRRRDIRVGWKYGLFF
jgi:hypothetical protein